MNAKAKIDTHILALEIEASKRLMAEVRALVGEDDEQAVADTFEGETNLEDALRKTILANDEDEIMVDGIKSREAELAERRQRAEKRIETRRGLIEQAMAVANWDSKKLDIATITRGKPKRKVEVEDESKIPTRFWKQPDPVLSKSLLNEEMKAVQSEIDAAQKLEEPARTDQLLEIAATKFGQTIDLQAAVTRARETNEPEQRAHQVQNIITVFSPVPGTRIIEAPGSLTIRRK